jgi:hypothetical protein
MTSEKMEEIQLRIHCILRHVQDTERDGLANSGGHLKAIEQDARALEDMLIMGEETTQPVHLERA